MARYIDADALVEMLNNKAKTDYEMGLYNHGALTQSFIRLVERQSAADVAPRAEVAREIFEEIEKIIKSPRTVGFCMTAPSFRQAISDYNEGIRKEILYYIAELKKKYTEPEPPKGD